MFLFDPPENIRKPFQVGQKETLGREGLSHLRQVFHSYKNRDFFFFFFGYPTANGSLSREQPHKPDFNHCIYQFKPDVTGRLLARLCPKARQST